MKKLKQKIKRAIFAFFKEEISDIIEYAFVKDFLKINYVKHHKITLIDDTIIEIDYTNKSLIK